jgi:hypothetical protein
MNNSPSCPFSRQLLHQLVKQKLISLELATQIDPMLLNEAPVPKWYAEAGDTALDADISVSFRDYIIVEANIHFSFSFLILSV